MTSDGHIDSLFDLTGDVAIVTGGAGQLGSQICDALSEAGAHVVVASRTIADCKAKAAALSMDHPDAMAVEVDVTDPDAVSAMVETVTDEFGSIDILVNNAYAGSTSSFEDMTVDEWRSSFETALTGTFLCSRETIELMRESGGGRIINIGSIYGSVAPDHSIYGESGLNNPANYGAAKAGVIQLTRWLAAYLGDESIRVNCISPGGFYNPEFEDRPDYTDEFVPNYESRTPLGRMGDETDLKGPVVFLAAEASKWVTGINLFVDGGWRVW